MLGQVVAMSCLAAWLGGEPSTSTRYDGGAVALIALISNPVQAVTLVLAAHLSGSQAVPYLALDRPRRHDLVFGMMCLAGLIAVGDLVSVLMGRDIVPPFVLEIFRTASDSSAILWLIIALVVAAPVGEEFLFRGFLFRGWLRGPADAGTIITLTAAIWSVLHLQYDWLGMAQVFVTGLLLGWIRWRSGSTTVTIALHAMLNLEGTIETLLALGASSQ